MSAQSGARSRVCALGRLVRIVLHLLHGAWLLQWRWQHWSGAQRQRRIRHWARVFLELLAIDLIVDGEPRQHGPLLLVANHVSWIDIVVLLALAPCRLVSKAEVHHWPLIGAMAARVGTLFIERGARRDAMRVVHQMAQALQDGQLLAVFPEGTTSDGSQVLPFHGNLLQAAIATDCAVQPLALRYGDRHSGALRTEPAYAGQDSVLQTLWRTLRTPGLAVRVCCGVPEKAQGRERRAWAADLRTRIQSM
ncbi:MAG: lysophospholipid acyltransferase family protein [Rhodoferax sp.]